MPSSFQINIEVLLCWAGSFFVKKKYNLTHPHNVLALWFTSLCITWSPISPITKHKIFGSPSWNYVRLEIGLYGVWGQLSDVVWLYKLCTIPKEWCLKWITPYCNIIVSVITRIYTILLSSKAIFLIVIFK